MEILAGITSIMDNKLLRISNSQMQSVNCEAAHHRKIPFSFSLGSYNIFDRAAHGSLLCNLLKQGHDLDHYLISDCDILAQQMFEMQ